MRRCVCPGSFDPVTFGHLDVVMRSRRLFDEVVVSVVHNPAKSGLFPLAERVDLLQMALDGVDRVRVLVVSEGLLVEHCRAVGAGAIVKGVRGAADIGHELPMALMNRHLSGVETILLPGDPAFAHVASSLVREVAAHGGDIRGMVPDVVLERLPSRLGRR